jgi:hypothetical protein
MLIIIIIIIITSSEVKLKTALREQLIVADLIKTFPVFIYYPSLTASERHPEPAKSIPHPHKPNFLNFSFHMNLTLTPNSRSGLLPSYSSFFLSFTHHPCFSFRSNLFSMCLSFQTLTTERDFICSTQKQPPPSPSRYIHLSCRN